VYLKSLSLNNFRKFADHDNSVDFADAKDYKEEKQVNIAPKATLIVGKNNSGKSTIIEALKRLVSNTGFDASDFNLSYLKRLFELYTPEYLDSDSAKEVPTLSFTFTIVIDNSETDLLTNIIPFMTIGDTNDSEVDIIAKWMPKDSEVFLSTVKDFVQNIANYKNQKFIRFLQVINNSDFELSYFNVNDENRDGFSLRKLIELESISANNITSEDCLSKAFSRIVDYRYQQLKDNRGPTVINKLDEEIIAINEKLTEHFEQEHTSSINASLEKMISSEKCQVLLRSDLNFQSLLKNVLKYEYIEGDNQIPEQQFGLGYTNLMMIIADIITYMEKYPEDSFNSQINLISIEEPETFMHPQMQELFIKNVNEMIMSLLEDRNKHVNSQIIITTHSPHILNSKIHEGGTFNNINYITSIDGVAHAVRLYDEIILDPPKQNKPKAKMKHRLNLRFMKKHVKFKVSELFFADAVVFVEGITEYTLLQYYLREDKRFNKHYISLILIDGAHGKVYDKLINTLNVPSLIITDIDFKRENYEKNLKEDCPADKEPHYMQMKRPDLIGRTTTNSTLSHYYKTKNIEQVINGDYAILGSLMVVCQKQENNGFFASSFEEALLLNNCDNNIIHKVLNSIKPTIYKDAIDNGGLANNSYKLQCKLANSKSDLANELLFQLLTNDEAANFPQLPQYIIDGLNFLNERLGGE